MSPSTAADLHTGRESLATRTTLLFEAALAGDAVHVRQADGNRSVLDNHRWLGCARGADLALLDRTEGPALDVGCGPGRLVAGLGRRRFAALGIDVDPYAVVMTRATGSLALRRSVFDPLPAEGRWQTVLLADGNIGIGGDPHRLLLRIVSLLGREGRVLVELAPPGAGIQAAAIRLEMDHRIGDWFRWARVSSDAVDGLAANAALRVLDRWTAMEESTLGVAVQRWFASLGVAL